MTNWITIGQGLPGDPSPVIQLDQDTFSLPREEGVLIFANPGIAPPDPFLAERTAFWKPLVFQALNKGFTVVVFLDEFEDFRTKEEPDEDLEDDIDLTDTPLPPEEELPEILRNQTTPTNYSFLPKACPELTEIEPDSAQLRSHPLFTPLWKALQPYLSFRCAINGQVTFPLALSKTEKKLVAGVVTVGKGNLLILPEIKWAQPALLHEDEWTPKALELGWFLCNYFTKLHPHLKGLK